tara:strand:- start:523 stop:702 length:180 start_codon:yes stop_codon:yes gene_type:complete
MTDYEAIMIAEGVKEVSKKVYVQAWQHLIDTGVCWKLQGWFGREANRMIDDGECKYDRR